MRILFKKFIDFNLEIYTDEGVLHSQYSDSSADCVFITLEKHDKGEYLNQTLPDLVNFLSGLTGRIYIIPYAHLSRSLLQSNVSDILEIIANIISSNGIDVITTPFGLRKILNGIEDMKYTKYYEDVLRSLSVESVSEEEYRFSGTELLPMDTPDYRVNMGGLSRDLQYYDRFSSIKGFPTYGPGIMGMFSILRRYVQELVRDCPIQIYEVKGPTLMVADNKQIIKHLQKFNERLFTFSGEKRFFLPYASCFSHFLLAANQNINYRNIPFGFLTFFPSFRYEQAGEISPLSRTREFLMPDIHMFINPGEILDSISRVHSWLMEIAKSFNFDIVPVITVADRVFYEQNRVFLGDLFGTGYIVFLDGTDKYWTFNVEYHVVTLDGKLLEWQTLQLDLFNSKNFGITYNYKGERISPAILHVAPIGSVERTVFLLSERGRLPFWITPHQVVLIPVSEKYMREAISLARQFPDYRILIDDRDLSVSRKISQVYSRNIPTHIVIGEREVISERYTVSRINETDTILGVGEIREILSEMQSGYPIQGEVRLYSTLLAFRQYQL